MQVLDVPIWISIHNSPPFFLKTHVESLALSLTSAALFIARRLVCTLIVSPMHYVVADGKAGAFCKLWGSAPADFGGLHAPIKRILRGSEARKKDEFHGGLN